MGSPSISLLLGCCVRCSSLIVPGLIYLWTWSLALYPRRLHCHTYNHSLFLKVCPRRVSTEVTLCSGNCPPTRRSRFQTTRYPTRHCFRGPQFASQVWREFCKSVDSTALRCATVHHPVSWSTPHSMHSVCAQLTHLFIHWHVSLHVSQLPTPSFFPSKWRQWLADAHRSPFPRIALDRWFGFLPVIFRWSSNHVCCLPTRLAILKPSRSSTPLPSSYSSQSL